ncbi:virulence RhuM family protein, partial [bacterium]|nr:virulence RhuM family protein [bacterium]
MQNDTTNQLDFKENEIVLYQPNDTIHLEVRMADETVWLTQAQLVELYQSSKANISEHIRHIFEEGELDENSTVRNFRTVQIEGNRKVSREQTFYNLDMIISLGYRVKSVIATRFRRWANSVLKEYLLKGYAVNQRFERLEQRVSRTEEKIEFFVRTSLPPVEGVFFQGQIFDAYAKFESFIQSAEQEIILIDNYIDISVLERFSKKQKDVKVTIYTDPKTKL